MRLPELEGACLTARGEGALAVFRVRGSGVPLLLSRVFRPHGRTRAVPGLNVGHLVREDRVIDEVVVHLEADREAAEISVHGGRGTRRAVLETLEAMGMRRVSPARLLASDPYPALRAEAGAKLERAPALQAALFHLAAVDGCLGWEVAGIRDVLQRHGDLDPGAREGIRRRLGTLLARAPLGRAHGKPPRLAVIGPPNAGKSTLNNRLLGEERSIVTPEPGTTRDLLRAPLVIEGHAFEIVDTAGLRTTSDAIEAAGVERAEALAREVDLVLLVLDATRSPPPDLRRWTAFERVLVVLNKMDLEVDPHCLDAAAEVGRTACRVSALTGEGMDGLRELVLFLSPFAGPATRDFPAVFTDRQVRLLESALERLESDPRGAAEALSEVLEGREDAS